MTLSRKMTIQLAALVGAVCLLAAAGLWGLLGLERELDSAVDEYQRLRAVYEAGLPIAAAGESLKGEQPDRDRAAAQLSRAIDRLSQFIVDDSAGSAAAQVAVDELRQALANLRHEVDDDRPPVAALAAVRRALNHIAAQVAATADGIRRTETAAAERLRRTILTGIAVALAILLAAVAVGISQYRSVMNPLRRVARGVRPIASGRFDQRLDREPTAEFAALAEEINRMTVQLDELYRDLERKVERTSRELVRSERLASVGYLAAGVAHEINNPLGIIAGHAELSRQALRDDADQTRIHESIEALGIITDEAFRCKQIIEKLLSLSRGGAGGRTAVSMKRVAQDVADMVAALQAYRDRRVEVRLCDDPLIVRASDAEMKQVLLNLVINALEATEAPDGRVTITGRRDGSQVRLAVWDNGRGMDAATLGRVFEPFYTTRPGAAPPGTGLGLSISHAIVTAHGGQLEAASEGPGRGSTFTLILNADAGDKA